MGRDDHEYLTIREGVWQYYRRVPAHFAHLDRRGTVKLSTKIKVARDREGNKASRVAARLNTTQEAYWRGLSEQSAADAVRAYDDAVRLCPLAWRRLPAAVRMGSEALPRGPGAGAGRHGRRPH